MKTTHCTVYDFAGSIDALTLPRLEKQEVRVDWMGSALEAPFKWSLARDASRLWVNIELPAQPAQESKHALGEFVEGLWLSDVVELFLMAPDGRYQEWNISADGAWWAMSFSSYRERSETAVRPEGVQVQIERAEASWQAILSVPLTASDIPMDPSTRAHVSGVMYTEGRPTYLSSAGAPPSKPDFHDRQHFRPLTFRQK